MKRGRDPYWTTAKFDSRDANGEEVKRGQRIFYYPNTKTVLSGEAAEAAAAEFAACLFDEGVMRGGLI